MKQLLTVVALALSVGVAFAGPDKAPRQDKCVVTGEKLGGMGKPINIAYSGKLAAYKGKSVKVCCGGCVTPIKKDPDKFFKTVYGAPKAPAKPMKGKPGGKAM